MGFKVSMTSKKEITFEAKLYIDTETECNINELTDDFGDHYSCDEINDIVNIISNICNLNNKKITDRVVHFNMYPEDESFDSCDNLLDTDIKWNDNNNEYRFIVLYDVLPANVVYYIKPGDIITIPIYPDINDLSPEIIDYTARVIITEILYQ